MNEPYRALAVLGLSLLTALGGTQPKAASFDCGKARARMDKLICANERLSQLDETLAQEYRKSLARSPDVENAKSEQRLWLRTRNRCQDTSCLEQAYRARIAGLRAPAPRALPPTPAVKPSEPAICHAPEASQVGINQNGQPTFVTSATLQGHDKHGLHTDRGEFLWPPWLPADRLDAMQNMAEGLKGMRARLTYSLNPAAGDGNRCWVEAIARNIGFLEKHPRPALEPSK